MSADQETNTFLDSADAVGRIQHEHLLESIVGPNVETEFGRNHGFDGIKSFHDYRVAVPLADYEDFRDPIDRMASGEENILTAQRATAFFKTSGSTAAPKLIPVTTGLVRDKARAFVVFWNLVYRDHPALREGKWIANFGDGGGVEKTESGKQVVSETSFWNRRMQMFQSGAGWPLPPQIRKIRDPDTRYYAVARMALATELNGIMCLNPSTLVKLCRTIEENRTELFDGVRGGTFGSTVDCPEELAGLDTDLLSPNPVRADSLEKAFDSHGMKMGAFWPGLDLTISWQSELVRPYVDQLDNYLTGVASRDYITQGSECIMAIPLSDGGSGGLLAYTCHYYEFIPESECEAANPETLSPWELDEGEVYELVVSTSGGLYRYRVGDCFRVVGQRGRVPLVDFLYRKGKTSSITGEKLTEMQVIEAARGATEKIGSGPAEFLCFPRSQGDPHYGVMLDWKKELGADGNMEDWVVALDKQLQAINGEYRSKRNSGRLGAPRTIPVLPSAFDRLRYDAASGSISIEQIKLGVLSRHLDLDAGVSDHIETR